jgi:hypothetical protein
MTVEAYGLMGIIITVLGGGLFGLITTLINKKTDKAKEVISSAVGVVDISNKTLMDMEKLVAQYRIRNAELEEDLREEKAFTSSLMSKMEGHYGTDELKRRASRRKPD